MKPFIQAGRKTYTAFITDCHGASGNRSLGTKDTGEALAICAELEFLERRMLMPADRSLAMISAMAYKLFYGVEKPVAMSASPRSGVDRREAVKIAENVSDLEAEIRELRAYKEKYEALSNSLEAQRFKAMQDAPTLADTRDAYIKDVQHLNRKGRVSRTWFELFCEAMGEDTKLAAITAGQIDAFIQSRVVGSKDPQRERKTRAEVTRYFGWAVRTYKITSPVEQLSRLNSKAEKDIEWHSPEEIEAVLVSEESTYWKAVIATFVYAGLSAHELRGLRRGDLIKLKNGKRGFRVTPHEARGLKTKNRKRSVMIAPSLNAYLDAHLEELDDSAQFIFPAQAGTREDGMWREGAFTRHLHAHLPEGMSALSLRRTCSSMLIRAGLNDVQVSAIIGNSPHMTRKHYARILGEEIHNPI